MLVSAFFEPQYTLVTAVKGEIFSVLNRRVTLCAEFV